jgi:hypothetical protein
MEPGTRHTLECELNPQAAARVQGCMGRREMP